MPCICIVVKNASTALACPRTAVFDKRAQVKKYRSTFSLVGFGWAVSWVFDSEAHFLLHIILIMWRVGNIYKSRYSLLQQRLQSSLPQQQSSSPETASTSSSHPGIQTSVDDKAALVRRLLAAKEQSGKTFDQIAAECGLTNAYTAQLFFSQAQLKPHTAPKLKQAVPAISDQDLLALQRFPLRSFHPNILQDPTVYRFYEAVTHYGEALKALVNEKCGDGIMSAIDMYVSVDKIKGKHGEDRIVVRLNGKFLPQVEGKAEDDTSSLSS